MFAPTTLLVLLTTSYSLLINDSERNNDGINKYIALGGGGCPGLLFICLLDFPFPYFFSEDLGVGITFLHIFILGP